MRGEGRDWKREGRSVSPTIHSTNISYMIALERLLEQLSDRWREAFGLARSYAPGVLVCGLIATAAAFLSEHYGAPVILFALLLGMVFNFLAQEGRCVAGIGFASKQILRIAVALLGAQVTFAQIAGLGLMPVVTVLFAVIATIVFGATISRLVGLEGRLGVLTGGAVAICGASAALALAAVLPKHDSSERDTAFTVIGVTTLSTLAMIFYPILVPVFKMDSSAAGIFLGGTIHDVAQVVGAGFGVSDETGNAATVTKLFRVAMLLPVILILSVIYGNRRHATGRRELPLPGFLIAFALLAAINSANVLPTSLLDVLKSLARICLIIAISALGIKTSLKALASVGGRAVVLLVCETFFLAGLVLAAVVWMR